jgi:hypothetical protein
LAIDVIDLRGGNGRVDVACELAHPSLLREEVEKLVAESLGGLMSFVASKYGLLPEDFASRASTVESEGCTSIEATCGRLGLSVVPTLAVHSVTYVG